MSEPTYEYEKGHGWVAKTYQVYYSHNKNGRPLRIIDRQPKKGELFVRRVGLEKPEQIIQFVKNHAYDDIRYVTLWDGHGDGWVLEFCDE